LSVEATEPIMASNIAKIYRDRRLEMWRNREELLTEFKEEDF
jgi:hypothetical protein